MKNPSEYSKVFSEDTPQVWKGNDSNIRNVNSIRYFPNYAAADHSHKRFYLHSLRFIAHGCTHQLEVATNTSDAKAFYASLHTSLQMTNRVASE